MTHLKQIKMSKKSLIYLAFFAVLLTGFYYFLFKGTDNWKVKMPVLSYVQPRLLLQFQITLLVRHTHLVLLAQLFLELG